jgi:hypothetical protein
MMRLELSTDNLDVNFECTDLHANDLVLLDAIRELVAQLEEHEGVTLSIVSKNEQNNDWNEPENTENDV